MHPVGLGGWGVLVENSENVGIPSIRIWFQAPEIQTLDQKFHPRDRDRDSDINKNIKFIREICICCSWPYHPPRADRDKGRDMDMGRDRDMEESELNRSS